MKLVTLIALLCLSACAEENHELQNHCEMTQLYADTKGEFGWPDYNNTAHLCAD